MSAGFGIQDNKLVKYSGSDTIIVIPDGVTEIPEKFLKDAKNLKKIVLPSSLKKIGKEAFSGCQKLKTIVGTNGAISYGKDVFQGCDRLIYTAEMFRNTGKLCDSFAEHMENCGSTELAWVLMYQRGAIWEKALSNRITKGNVREILENMITHIEEAKKPSKKAATAAASYITTNVMQLSKEGITRFCQVSVNKKMTDIADAVKQDLAVAHVLGKQTESVNVVKTQIPNKILTDGRVLYGEIQVPIKPGSCFCMGKKAAWWRILSIDEKEQTAIVIAEDKVCERAYHEKNDHITWEKCTLRDWLNGEYYEEEFSAEEKAAILECDIKNPDNAEYGTKGGSDTKDKIWLLSIDEADQCFGYDRDRATSSWWWLRSPGIYDDFAAVVSNDGSVYYDGSNVGDDYFGVRPTFKLNLNSGFVKSIVSTNLDGEAVILSPELVIKNGMLLNANPMVTDVTLPPFVKKIDKGAFENCKEISALNWEADNIKIDEDAFASDAKLILPAEYYLGSRLPHKNFAEFAPKEPKVIANLLVLAGKESAYRQWAISSINPENVQSIAEEIVGIVDMMKKIKSSDNIMRFVLASYQCISKELLDKFCGFLELYPENEVAIKALQRAAADMKDMRMLRKTMFDIPTEIILTDNKYLTDFTNLLNVLQGTSDYTRMYGEGLNIKGGILIKADAHVTNVIIPSTVKEIGEEAFCNCTMLKTVSFIGEIPKIRKNSFVNCPLLKLPEELYMKKIPQNELAAFIPDNINIKTIANLILFAGPKTDYPRKAIEFLTIDNAEQVADEMLRLIVGYENKVSTVNVLLFTFSVVNILDEKQSRKLIDFLEGFSKYRNAVRILSKESKKKNPSLGIIKQFFYINWEILNIDSNLAAWNSSGVSAVIASAGDYVAMYHMGEVDIRNYRTGVLDTYHRIPEAEKIAESIDRKTLMSLLEHWSRIDPEWYAPYAIYANEKEVTELLAEMKYWENWNKKELDISTYDFKKTNEKIIRVRGAALLSDTKAALDFAVSENFLETYAKIRGKDEDYVRDSIVCKVEDENLESLLSDDNKKLSNRVKQVVKIQTEALFSDFLSGRYRNCAIWKEYFLTNPVCLMLGCKIVWEQNNNTFIISQDGKCYDADGSKYNVSDQPIRIAHPMEMGLEQTRKWQNYFENNHIMQPFVQVWEPVMDSSLVLNGRYDECSLPISALMNKEKHGIMIGKRPNNFRDEYYWAWTIELKDCRARLVPSETLIDEQGQACEGYIIRYFSYKCYNRQVNHIVILLDKETVACRIKKDDISIEPYLSEYNRKQIMDFIDLAIAHKANHVLAILMQYVQNHYREYNVMNEFSLNYPEQEIINSDSTELMRSKKQDMPYFFYETNSPNEKRNIWEFSMIDTIEFEGKIFVLTGFDTEEKAKITRMIEERGGVIKSSTVLKTNYLIVMDGYDHKTTKYLRAKELQEQGKNIVIIGSEQFYSLCS